MLDELLDLTVPNVNDDAQQHTADVDELTEYTTFRRICGRIAYVWNGRYYVTLENGRHVRADKRYLEHQKYGYRE